MTATHPDAATLAAFKKARKHMTRRLAAMRTVTGKEARIRLVEEIDDMVHECAETVTALKRTN